eukprot:g5522.t1
MCLVSLYGVSLHQSHTGSSRLKVSKRNSLQDLILSLVFLCVSPCTISSLTDEISQDMLGLIVPQNVICGEHDKAGLFSFSRTCNLRNLLCLPAR